VIHVLYVDDEPALLDLTRLYLERTGEFSVDTVLSAREALGKLKNGQYDVILSDYQMPEMDGIQFLQQIRKEGSILPFIIFTGRGREEVVIEAINSGADSYIQKGGNPRAQFADLEQKLRQTVRRSHAERALREAEARYRAIFQHSSDITWIIDKTGRITYDTPSSARILGYPAGSLIGRNPLEYISPDDRDRFQGFLVQVSDGKNPGAPLEVRMRRSDGGYLWVESVASHIPGVKDVDGIVVTTRLIEDRRQAEDALKKKHEELTAAFEQLTATEEELRQNYNELATSERKLAESEHLIRASEAYLRCVITDAREGITAYDTDMRFTLWNPYMEELTGIPGGDIVGKRLEDRFPGFRETDFPEKLMRVLAGETIESPDIPIDLSIKKKKVWLRCIASPLFDHEGKRTGVIGIVQDITARKEAELALVAATDALKESEEKYRNVFEAKNNPLILIDAETRKIIDVNEAASEMYGYSRDEMLNLELLDLSGEPEKTLDTVERHIPRVSLRYHRRKDGMVFPADITLAYFTLKGRSVMILSVRDLSGIKQVDDALRVANVKLNLMIGVTRHDVLNSLTALLGYNAILKDRGLDPTTEEYLDKQEKALLAIRTHIEFTRIYDDLGVKAPVWQHVGNTVAQAYAQFINTIAFTCETGDLEIYADPMLEKVFYNLFDNAFRYGEDVTAIRLYGSMEGTDLILYFEDNGVGVPDTEKSRIFSRGVGKNTGLGLFLTREILAITRIGITETGEYRKGARFAMRIPRGAYRIVKT